MRNVILWHCHRLKSRSSRVLCVFETETLAKWKKLVAIDIITIKQYSLARQIRYNYQLAFGATEARRISIELITERVTLPHLTGPVIPIDNKISI